MLSTDLCSNFLRRPCFLLNAQVLNYECKCVHVHNLDLKLSTLFIETTLIGREFHILITDGKNECKLRCKKPRVELALLIILVMCSFQERFSVMVTPRYLADVTLLIAVLPIL